MKKAVHTVYSTSGMSMREYIRMSMREIYSGLDIFPFRLDICKKKTDACPLIKENSCSSDETVRYHNKLRVMNAQILS